MEIIRVVIADDHEMVRAGIRGWLEMEEDIRVVGEARSGEEALRIVKELLPDILLQDIQMPDIDGVEVIRRITGERIATRILAITGFDSREAKVALDGGACGYLTKEERREVIVEAVRWAAAGGKGVWISPSVAADLTRSEDAVKRAELTKAEVNVLRHIEHSNGTIAQELSIAEGTVKNHITSIYEKLGVHSRLDAVRWARANGIIG